MVWFEPDDSPEATSRGNPALLDASLDAPLDR
jgi:hypothetical protein